MTSWRDTASAEAQEQLDELLNVALDFAQHELSKRGEFFPFAAAIGNNGQPGLIALRLDERERPPSGEVLDACFAVLSEKRAEIRAAAVVSDVTTPDGDAICVDLEHVEGHSIAVLLPYTKKRLGKKFDYGLLRAEAGSPRVWPAPDPQ